MKTHIRLSIAGSLMVLTACGSTVSSGVPSDGGREGSIDHGDVQASFDSGMGSEGGVVADGSAPWGQGKAPPARPAVSGTGGQTRWFAISKLAIGLTTPSGASDPSAWKQYGYDLDGRTTTREDSKTSSNTCKRIAGSGTTVLGDGDQGTDNNYGQHVMAVIKSLKSDAEDAVNQEIADGKRTMLLRLDNVGAADNANVPGALYLGTAFDGTTWKIDASSVSGGQAKLKFAGGYMRGGVWVSGELGTVSGPLPLMGGAFGTGAVQTESIVISFDTATGRNGQIAGAARAAAVVSALRPIVTRFGICPGNATYDQVVDTLAQSADLVSGAPQLQDTTRECDALSMGFGFVAAPTSPATSIVTVPPPGPDECSTDGGF